MAGHNPRVCAAFAPLALATPLGAQSQLEARGSEVAQVRAEMAAEVSAAAQQVQQLLAAQRRVAELEAELEAARGAAEAAAAAAEEQAPLRVAEAVAAARADARLELDRLEGLLAQVGRICGCGRVGGCDVDRQQGVCCLAWAHHLPLWRSLPAIPISCCQPCLPTPCAPSLLAPRLPLSATASCARCGPSWRRLWRRRRRPPA